MRDLDPYPSPPWRQRAVVALLAVATAVVVMWLMTRPVSKVPPEKIPEPPRCSGGRTTGCVGGTATVINLPASAPR